MLTTLVGLLPLVSGALAASLITSRAESFASCFSSADKDATLVTQSSSAYAADIQPFNLRLPYDPNAVVYATSVKDVVAAVHCASVAGLPAVARSGGHSYASYSLGGQNGSVVIDLSKMKEISLDTSTGLVTVQTGNRLGDLALSIWNSDKRALPHGTCPYVGTGGHPSFGGYGILSRQEGLLLDRITSAQVVLANGTVVTASSSSNTDLFWAIRGAAPSFGIVTQWTFQTVAAPSNVVDWNVKLPKQNIAQMTSTFLTWQSFVWNAPTALVAFTDWGADGNGGISMSFTGAYIGTQANFMSTVQPWLNKLPSGYSLTTNNVNWIQSVEAFGVPQPVNTSTQPDTHDTFFAKSLMNDSPLSNASITSYITYLFNHAANADLGWFAQVDLYGGQIAAVGEDDTAYAHRNATLTWQLYGTQTKFPSDGVSFINNMLAALDPNPQAAYPNYVDPTLTPAQWQSLYFDGHYSRLQSIKKAVDPGNVFRFPQSIGLPS